MYLGWYKITEKKMPNHRFREKIQYDWHTVINIFTNDKALIIGSKRKKIQSLFLKEQCI